MAVFQSANRSTPPAGEQVAQRRQHPAAPVTADARLAVLAANAFLDCFTIDALSQNGADSFLSRRWRISADTICLAPVPDRKITRQGFYEATGATLTISAAARQYLKTNVSS
jgi:hypothetical protein